MTVSMVVGGTVVVVVGTVVVAALGCAWLRQRAFRRLLHYDPARNQHYALERLGGNVVEILCGTQGFQLPQLDTDVTAAFLPLEIDSTFAGKFCDPWIEMTAGGVVRRQYFERGAKGTRYLNLSGFFNNAAPLPSGVWLRGKHVTWREQRTRLAWFSDRLTPSDKVVVVAPHPDDAEIAAFGVYSSTNAVVVTVSAGDATDSFAHALSNGRNVAHATVAKIRTWDSIMIPKFGGVEPERAVNLAYPDGQLAAMFANPDREFDAEMGEADFQTLRTMNPSSLVPREKMHCTWRSLVTDLAQIFRQVNPDAIVTPFPLQDPHLDHSYTTVAVCEALRESGLRDVRILLCVIHNRWSELYPFGPAGSDVSLPPLFNPDELDCDGLCVIQLSAEQEQAKFYALEAMHDLREAPASCAVDWRLAWKQIRAHVYAAIHGLGLPPTSYLRRAVRPQELFFVVQFDRLTRLVEQFTRSAKPTIGQPG